MTADRYLRHVTLQTGHSRESPRSEVSPEAIDFCRLAIAAAAETGEASLAVAGLVLVAPLSSLGKHAALWQVWRAEDSRARDHVLTLAVAAKSRAGAPLWFALHKDRGDCITDPLRCPAEPWCAVRMEEGSIGQPDEVLIATGDLARCLAWAWLERER